MALGDVSGKAAPAALYAALVSGIMRSSEQSVTVSIEDARDLERRAAGAPHRFAIRGHALRRVERRQPDLQIANAGAIQPLFCRAGEVETIHAEGFPLGMFPGATYEEFSLATRPGDAIIFFSDGIVDAQTSTGDMFGNERLVEVVRKNQHRSAANIADAILSEVGRSFRNRPNASTMRRSSCCA